MAFLCPIEEIRLIFFDILVSVSVKTKTFYNN